MKFLFLCFMVFLSSCGEPLPSDPYVEKQFFANELKLISSDIPDPRDPRTFKQEIYNLSQESRVLVRLESMQTRTSNTVISRSKRMYFSVSSPELESRYSDLSAGIQVCPVRSNWMMLATWTRAHPFPTNSGRWSRAGGDFQQSDCFLSVSSYPTPEPDTLYFDVSDWYLYQLQSRSENFGLIIVSNTGATIYGDENIRKGPKFIWTEL